jgi:hypothetical protein
MLEARPLKAALAGSGSELALIVSDYVYNNLVRRYPSLVSPDAFRPVKFQVKYTRAPRVDLPSGGFLLVTAGCGCRSCTPRPGIRVTMG